MTIVKDISLFTFYYYLKPLLKFNGIINNASPLLGEGFILRQLSLQAIACRIDSSEAIASDEQSSDDAMVSLVYTLQDIVN